MFSLLKETSIGRLGTLHTPHGDVPSPFFMPVATAGAMKGLTLDHVRELGADILLSNTYHLHLHPGEDVVADAGGLHSFIGWEKPMLTDSGGFQVFSLRGIRKISDAGVEFQSHRSGEKKFLGPKEAMHVQHKLGADIIMCFDECPPSTAPRAEIEKAVDRTLLWAKECKRVHEEMIASRKISRKSKKSTTEPESLTSLTSLASCPLLFGIVQGGLEQDLRKKCAEELIAIGFDGYAIGGLAVGETPEEMFGVLKDVCPVLPREKPRYLMGVGRTEQMTEAVKLGIDMFDCVLPMREARHGRLIMSDGSHLRIHQAAFKNDHSVIDADSPSRLSREHTKSYLHHLLALGERYGETIACMNNLAVTLESIRALRSKISSP